MLYKFEMPKGYDEVDDETSYLNPSKLPIGEHKLRVVMSVIIGWIDWKDQKPYRYREGEQPSTSFNHEKPMKKFWGLYVWSYEKQGLFVMEVTQKGILKTLIALYKDENWGDLNKYDIKIVKKIIGGKTNYDVHPQPPTEMSEKIKVALKARPVRLEALFEGGDPWKDAHAPKIEKIASIIPEFKNGLEELREHLEVKKLPSDRLEEFIQALIKKQNETRENVINYCLKVRQSFELAYSKFLGQSQSQIAT